MPDGPLEKWFPGLKDFRPDIPEEFRDDRGREWTSTKRGRVVYDRKKHYFTMKDVERILTAIERQEAPQSFLEDFSDFFFAKLMGAYSAVLPDILEEPVRHIIESINEWFKDFLIERDFKVTAGELWGGLFKAILDGVIDYADEHTLDLPALWRFILTELQIAMNVDDGGAYG